MTLIKSPQATCKKSLALLTYNANNYRRYRADGTWCCTGSTQYSESSFVWRSFSPKPFEVAMLRGCCGPKGPLFRSSSSPKVVMFRRFHIPKGPPLYGWFYIDGSLVRSLFSPKGTMFRRFHIPKITPPLYGFYITKFLYLEGCCVPKMLCSEHRPWYLSGVPDYFGRNKISSGGDPSHYSSASLY